MKKNKKWTVIIGAGIVALLAVLFIMYFLAGDKTVKFEIMEESNIPSEITKDVVPEYRTLERALACKVDGNIYVLVSRGEKPTSGFEVSIDKMKVESKDDKENLIVYADFKDPAKETALAQVLTYPMQTAKTDLKKLPDTVELRIQYQE